MIWFNNWSFSGALPITEDGGESFNNFNDCTHFTAITKLKPNRLIPSYAGLYQVDLEWNAKQWTECNKTDIFPDHTLIGEVLFKTEYKSFLLGN